MANNNEEPIHIDDLYEYKISIYSKNIKLDGVNDDSTEFDETMDEIKLELTNPSMCKGINPAPQLRKATLLVVLRGFVSVSEGPYTIGVASMHLEKDNKVLKLDLLCANSEYKGVGSTLIAAIKEFCENNDIMKISLYSVPRAFGFYLKMEFESNVNPISMHYLVNKNYENSNSNSNSNSSNSNNSNSNNSNNSSNSNNSNNSNKNRKSRRSGGTRRRIRRTMRKKRA